jgi:LmbE family N-acetylglucosaminyl deacetylase
VLVISPHLDDACLSYGAQIARRAAQGDRVVVHTVFAGSPAAPYSPLAERYHTAWGTTGDVLAVRRAEDREAMRMLGAEPRHGHRLDAIYRRGPGGRWLVEERSDIFTGGTGAEPDLVAGIRRDVERLIAEVAPDEVVTAAAIGGHVDHVRTRDATLAAAGQVPVLLWEDLPYALQYGSAGEPDDVVGSPADKARKFRAVQCYASQLPNLGHRGASVVECLDSYGSGPDGGYLERVFRPGQTGAGTRAGSMPSISTSRSSRHRSVVR